MIRTLARARREERDGARVPRTAEDAVPVRRVWRDGVFLVGRSRGLGPWRFAVPFACAALFFLLVGLTFSLSTASRLTNIAPAGLADVALVFVGSILGLVAGLAASRLSLARQ